MTVKRLQSCCFIFISFFCFSVENCAELKFINPESVTFYTFVDGWVNITFQLDMEKCTEDQQYTLVIETHIKTQNPEIHCKILQNKTSCSLTERSNTSCHCESKIAKLFKKVDRPGEVVGVWRWYTNSSTGERKQKERSFKFYVPRPEETSRDTLTFILGSVCGFLVVIALVLVCRRLKPRFVGAELKFINPESLTFYTFVNGWINITFQLDLEKCTEDQQYTLVIETHIKTQNPEIHCKIIQNKTSCSLTERSHTTCNCELKTAKLFKKVDRPGEVVGVWRWYVNSSTGEREQKERSFTFYVTPPEKKSSDTVKFILAGVCGFLIVIVLVLLVCRRLKPRLSNVDGDMKHEKTIENQSTNPETPAPPATGGEMLEAGPEYVVITEDMYCEAWDHVKRSQIPPGAVRVLVDSGPRSFSKK